MKSCGTCLITILSLCVKGVDVLLLDLKINLSYYSTPMHNPYQCKQTGLAD